MDNHGLPDEYELPAETSGRETLAKIAAGVALGIIATIAIIAAWVM